MDDLERIVAAGQAYAARRAEVLPKAIEAIGGPAGWANGLLEELGHERTAVVVGTFLHHALCGIEERRFDRAIPPSKEERDFMTLCREAGCHKVALDGLARLEERGRPLPRAHLRPSHRRCCLLHRKAGAPLLAFSQIELYAKTRGLRFAWPEEMLELAIAWPELRFERCYAIGEAVDDGARGGGRVYVLADHGQEGNSARYIREENLPMTWTDEQRILAIKID